jgi:cobalt-zinc-cadmium efflux system outer membrane protein
VSTPRSAGSAVALVIVVTSAAVGQATDARPLTRAEAVASALASGVRLRLARADTAVAFAELLSARAFQNPNLISEYTKSTPQLHFTAELPFDYTLRNTRVRVAQAARESARYKFEFDRAVIALDADTTYTRAVAALTRARLSRRNAVAADSLRRMVEARRDAGDASDLDVELAVVNAGQQENIAAADSLGALSTVFDLQLAIGVDSGDVAIVPVDSLTEPPAEPAGGFAGMPLPVAAAEASLRSAGFAVRRERRSLFASSAITAGFETKDPSGAETGILPVIGLTIPLPFFNRNRGPIAVAEAERERALATLELARLEARIRIARASRSRDVAAQKVERDRRLFTSAQRVAALSLTAYREGASSLPNVLEAQRNAREVLAQYVDDLASIWIATAALRVYRMTPTDTAPP